MATYDHITSKEVSDYSDSEMYTVNSICFSEVGGALHSWLVSTTISTIVFGILRAVTKPMLIFVGIIASLLLILF